MLIPPARAYLARTAARETLDELKPVRWALSLSAAAAVCKISPSLFLILVCAFFQTHIKHTSIITVGGWLWLPACLTISVALWTFYLRYLIKTSFIVGDIYVIFFFKNVISRHFRITILQLEISIMTLRYLSWQFFKGYIIYSKTLYFITCCTM